MHSIPCKTAYSGPARVRTFFQPVVDVEQQRLQAEHSSATAFGVPRISAFRGRTLRGAEITLPESFSGTCALLAPPIFRRSDYARHSHSLRETRFPMQKSCACPAGAVRNDLVIVGAAELSGYFVRESGPSDLADDMDQVEAVCGTRESVVRQMYHECVSSRVSMRARSLHPSASLCTPRSISHPPLSLPIARSLPLSSTSSPSLLTLSAPCERATVPLVACDCSHESLP